MKVKELIEALKALRSDDDEVFVVTRRAYAPEESSLISTTQMTSYRASIESFGSAVILDTAPDMTAVKLTEPG